jgi:hypothetical protein
MPPCFIFCSRPLAGIRLGCRVHAIEHCIPGTNCVDKHRSACTCFLLGFSSIAEAVAEKQQEGLLLGKGKYPKNFNASSANGSVLLIHENSK